MRITAAALVAVAVALAGCAARETTATAPQPTTSTTMSNSTPPPVDGPGTTAPAEPITTLVSFAEPNSVGGWTNVDDTVMGGESDSTTTWVDGRMVFAGSISLANNGGFTSTLGPVTRALGERARASTAIALDARGASRSYLLWLRAGPEGTDRWVANFAPGPDGACCPIVVPFSEFRSVGRFLQPTSPSAPFDPATIVQIGFYLTDKQQGPFRLEVGSIDAVR